MADIGISYAHVDAPAAMAVRRSFLDRGLSIWMDEADEPAEQAEAIGLPWGQAHWDVITAEFSSADVIVVVDTPAWRRSGYCQAEYEFVRAWGKWVEFVAVGVDGRCPPPRIDEIVGLVAARRPVTSAHARLLTAARLGAPRQTTRLEKLLQRDEERDAHMVLSSSPESSGVVVTDRLAGYAAAVIERTVRARKRLRRMAVTAVAILAILTVIGVVALFAARSAERSATQSAAHSQSLGLAAQSTTSTDTRLALSLAREAGTLWPGREATEAINIAEANDARLRTLVIGPENYRGATWAANAPVIVAYTDDKLVVLDSDTGEQVRSVVLEQQLRLGTVAVSSDARQAAFVTAQGQHLHVADLHTGEVRPTNILNVNVVTTGDGNDLWWAADSGLYRGSFANLDTAAAQRYALPTPALAVDVSPDRDLVDYIDAQGTLHNAHTDGSTLVDSAVVPLVPTGAPPAAPSPIGEPIASVDAVAEPGTALAASVRRCGNNLFGGILGLSALKGTSFSVIDGVLDVEAQFGSPQPPVCGEDGSGWYSTLMPGGPSMQFGTAKPVLPSGAERTLAIADPSGTRVAAITNNGRLYHIPADRTHGYAADGALAMLHIGTSDYLLAADGRIVHAVSGASAGSVPTAFAADSAVAVGDYGMVATPDTLWRIDDQGHSSEVADLTRTTIYSLRGGADGRTFVGTTADGVVLIDPVSAKLVALDIDELAAGEAPVDADIMPGGGEVSFATNAGRVGTIGVDHDKAIAAPQFIDHPLPPGARTVLSYLPDSGELIVASSDGTVRLFDENLKVTSIAFYGGTVDHMAAVDGSVILSSHSLGTTIYAGDTLTAQDRLPPDDYDVDPSSVRLDVEAKRLVGLDVGDPQNGEHSTRKSIPLPTL